MIELALALAIAALGAFAVPAAGMRLLWPSIESSGRSSTNYRGKTVFLGLGTVWVFWILAVRVLGASGMGSLGETWSLLAQAGAPGATVPVERAALSVVWAMLFGLIDDVWGTSDSRGFKGHLSALARGRLTTGALKLFGIGFVSLAAGVSLATERSGGTRFVWDGSSVATAISATMVVALSANLLNLLDLRPGRALKGYLGYAFLVSAAIVFLGGELAAPGITTAAIVLVWLTGPAIAVWRYDLGERGMLGDAGANAAGVLVGYAAAWVLPLPGLIAAAILLLSVNLLSEKVSFSRVIEATPALRWLDGLGRKD